MRPLRLLLLAVLAAALVAAPAASAASAAVPLALGEPAADQVCRADLTNAFSVYQCTLVVVGCLVASFLGGACVA